MASPRYEQFIDQALSSDTTFRLSYGDPQQKWVIRTHLLSLLGDNPSFTVSFGTFTHSDGTAAHLLCAAGTLRPSAVPIVVWLHQNHPFMAPIVELSPRSPARDDHPFVTQSGLATCPYLVTWSYPDRSSLSSLLRNLSRLFSRDHPLLVPPAAEPRRAPAPERRWSMSKTEALDRLAGSAYYDLAALRAAEGEEVAALEGLREKAAERGRRVGKGVAALRRERIRLRKAAAGVAERVDALVGFLKVNDLERIAAEMGEVAAEMAFEVDGSEELEAVAAERGVEDAIYALEKALETGVVGIEAYVKQVRVLARDQFFLRRKLLQTGALTCPHYS